MADIEADIQIEVNGSPRRIAIGASVEMLLRDLDLDGRTVVVELNRQIVRRTELADTTLETGDRVELVHFVGGG